MVKNLIVGGEGGWGDELGLLGQPRKKSSRLMVMMVMIRVVLVTMLVMLVILEVMVVVVVIVVMLEVVEVVLVVLVLVVLVLKVVVGGNYPHSLSLTEEPRWQRGGESL